MSLTAAETIATPLPRTDRRAALATASRLAAMATFYAVIVLSPFRARFYLQERDIPPIFTDYTDIILFWNQVLVIAVLAFWLVSLALQPRRVDFGPLLIRIPVALIAIVLFGAAAFSSERLLATYNAVVIVGLMVLALYVINEVRSVSQVLPAVGLMVVIQAVVAITQVVSQQSFGLISLGEFDLDPADPGRSIVWTQDSPRLLRGYGLSDHPNILGGVLAAALLAVLAGITGSPNIRSSEPPGRDQDSASSPSPRRERGSGGEDAPWREASVAVACGVFAVGVAAVLITFSRAAALGLAAGLAFALLLVLLRRDWRTLGLWIAACVVAFMVAAPLVRPYSEYLSARVNPSSQPVGSTEERALSEREALARNTNEIFVANPATGVGAGVLPEAMKKAFPDFTYHYSPAHVVILVVAAETGIVGAFAYGVLMVAPFLLLWLRRDRLTPELIGVSGAVVALTVVGLLDYYTWSLDAGRLWFWLTLGLWVVAYRRSERQAYDA